MLIEFLVENYRSIGAEQRVSLVASKEATHPDHIIGGVVGLKPGVCLLRSILLYGANASGKSNLCRSLFVMRRLVVASATELNEGDPLPGVEPFRLSARREDEPSTFEVNVSLSSGVYRYGFSATSTEIVREWLYLTRSQPGSKEILLFDREGLLKENWRFGPSFRGRVRHLIDLTRASNCLLLSKAAQESFEQVVPLYEWFREKLVIVNMASSPGMVLQQAAVKCHEDGSRRESLAKVVKVADQCVATVCTSEESLEVPGNFKPLVATLFPGVDLPDHVEKTEFQLGRRMADSDESVNFDLDDESNGTRRFVAISNLLIDSFEKGQVLIIDELECSLHPTLTRQIIETMNDPQLGRNFPQFVVATHETNLFDFDLLRRDQIYLVQKGLDHESEVYSLYDINPKPRGDAAAEKQYLSERFGGVPRLGNLRVAIADALASGSCPRSSPEGPKTDQLQ